MSLCRMLICWTSLYWMFHAGCHYAESCYVACHYAKCRYAECDGALKNICFCSSYFYFLSFFSWWKLKRKKLFIAFFPRPTLLKLAGQTSVFFLLIVIVIQKKADNNIFQPFLAPIFLQLYFFLGKLSGLWGCTIACWKHHCIFFTQ